MANPKINMKGFRVGKLTVIDYHGSKNGQAYWMCKCDCGNIIIARGNHLRSGNVKSCGCLRGIENKNRAKHNMSRSTIYNTYHGMIKRCYLKSNNSYARYGGRGIRVCDEWMDKQNGFDNFYKWALESGYKQGLSIDRIDVNGNYEPSNCKWATAKEQANNRSNTPHIEHEGETHTPSEWSEILGISREIILDRYKRGLVPKEILNTKNITRKRVV